MGEELDTFFRTRDEYSPPFDMSDGELRELRQLTVKTKEQTMSPRIKKPVIIKVGNHYIDPTDVACVTKVQSKDLYIVRLKSQPNMEYPIWVKKTQIGLLLDHFDIQTSDESSED